jgi:hypothetical protein
VIIPHEVGVPGLKRVLILLFSLLPASLILLSCGGYSSPSGSGGGSGLKYRAFITNNVSAGTGFAGVYTIDASKDVRAAVAPISAGTTPGMMVVTPNRTLTLVFSPGINPLFPENQFTVINNATEAAVGHVILPGLTESFVVSPDGSATYIAVPTGPVIGQSPGVIDVISLSTGARTAEISCPAYNPNVVNPVCLPNPVPQPPPSVCNVTPYVCGGFNPPYRFLSIGNTGNRVLAFSEGSDAVANAVAVITPSSVGTAKPVVTFASGSGPTAFDHPVWAFFNSDDTIAYVVNCGAECGGTQASVQKLDLTTNTAGTPVPVPAATVALVNNSTMYLAGTPLPAVSCTVQQVQTTCGELTTFDLASMSVVGSPVPINDGYHNRIALGANGQLFIGARTCSQAGCLSIYNTQNVAVGTVPPGGVGFPPATGDVTGIQPIATRTVVYVTQGGSLGIYDTKTDALQSLQITNLIGQFIDVKTIDF